MITENHSRKHYRPNDRSFAVIGCPRQLEGTGQAMAQHEKILESLKADKLERTVIPSNFCN